MILIKDNILVRREEDPNEKASAIIILDEYKDKSNYGTVMIVGPGAVSKRGDRLPMQTKVGDRVVFAKYSGMDIKVDGVEHSIMKDSDVILVLEDAE